MSNRLGRWLPCGCYENADGDISQVDRLPHLSHRKPKPWPTILNDAAGLVDGERSADYGPPEQHHKQTGRVWAAIISRHYGIDLGDLPPRVVDMMFVGDKAVREAHQHKRDSLVDICGYARCAEIAEEGRP